MEGCWLLQRGLLTNSNRATTCDLLTRTSLYRVVREIQYNGRDRFRCMRYGRGSGGRRNFGFSKLQYCQFLPPIYVATFGFGFVCDYRGFTAAIG